MKTLDYFYEMYVEPVIDGIREISHNFIIFVLSTLLFIALWVTLPIWVIPYVIYKKKEGAEE